MTAALFGARSFAIFASWPRGRHESPIREPGLSVGRDPAPVRREQQRVDLQLLERGIARRVVRREGEKIPGKVFERESPPRRARAAPSPVPCSFQRKSSTPGAFRLAAWRPCFTSPGRRSAVDAPAARAPYHSVRTPPRPKTRTGPNAGSCLKERSASAAGEPGRGLQASRGRGSRARGRRAPGGRRLPRSSSRPWPRTRGSSLKRRIRRRRTCGEIRARRS